MHRYLLLILLVPILALAAEDWDKRFDEMCNFDKKWCHRLKTSDGGWQKPKVELLAVLRTPEVQDEIKATAAKCGVDPLAIGGSIVAENSMNVTKVDSAQTWLAKTAGITGINLGVYKREFTFGMGQISITTAIEADAHMAKIEGRAPRSSAELTKEISEPLGSIRLVGAILRKVQDDYKDQGFDISKDVGVLTTLYNLGDSERRAKETKEAKLQPRMNYFGLFVTKYAPDVRSAMTPKPTTTPPPTTNAAVISATASSKNDAEELGRLAKRGKPTPASPKAKPEVTQSAPAPAQVRAPAANLVQIETVKTSVPLLGAPHLCSKSDDDRDDRMKTTSASYGAPTGILEKGRSFKEVSRTLDCNAIPWKLVESEDGKSGWIKETVLDEARATGVQPARNCEAEKKEAATCAAAVSSALGEKVAASDSKMMVFASPVGPKLGEGDSKVVNFAREDFECRDRDKKQEDYNQSRYSRPRTQLSLNEVAKEYDKYKQQQSQARQKQIAQINQQTQQMMAQYQAQIAQLQAAQAAAQAASGSAPSTSNPPSTNMMPMGMFGGIMPTQTPGGPQSTPPRPPDKEIAEANLKFYDQQANTLAKALKIAPQDLTGAANPYARVGEFIMARRAQAAACSVSLRSENRRGCEIDPVSDELKAAFAKLKYERVPDVDDAQKASEAIENAESYGNRSDGFGRDRDRGDIAPYMVYLPGEPELQNKSAAEIRAAIADCATGLDALRKKDDDDSKVPKIDDLPLNSPASGGGMGMGMVGAYGNYSQMTAKQRRMLYRMRNGGGSSGGGQFSTGVGDAGGYGDYDTDPEPFFRAAKVATDEQIQKYAAEFISLGKFCHSRLNVIKDSSTSGATIQCTQAPDYMTIGDGQFSRAVVAKTYAKNPKSLIDSVEENVPLFVKPDIVKEILGEDKFKPLVKAKVRQQDDEERFDPRGPSAYCPNRTADKIEDLLKENPCIKRVYVPTRFLSNKLGPNDPRVVYRQFEQNDRYGVEVGSVSCEK